MIVVGSFSLMLFSLGGLIKEGPLMTHYILVANVIGSRLLHNHTRLNCHLWLGCCAAASAGKKYSEGIT